MIVDFQGITNSVFAFLQMAKALAYKLYVQFYPSKAL